MRLDVYLTDRNLASTRTRAKNLIELKRVKVNGKTTEKPAYDVREGDIVELTENYDASLGGIKLRGALEELNLSVQGRSCLDIGAANGGFCDVLLEKGAAKVIALDVGECALPERLTNNPIIYVMDRTNARFLTPEKLPFLPDFITVDVSFISLKQILPVVYLCLQQNGFAVCLIKPQFECGKKALSKKGIVTDKREEQKCVESVRQTASSLGFTVGGVRPAPHPFENKNQEYFIFLQK